MSVTDTIRASFTEDNTTRAARTRDMRAGKKAVRTLGQMSEAPAPYVDDQVSADVEYTPDDVALAAERENAGMPSPTAYPVMTTVFVDVVDPRSQP